MRRRSPLNAPVPRDAAAALSRGPADERRDASRVLMPTAREIMQTQQFQDLYSMAKADVPKPVPGAAMALVDIGDTGGQRVQFARPVGLGFDSLRTVVSRGMIFNLIVNTRIRQVQAFLNTPEGEADPGFKLRFKDKLRPVLDEDKERFSWLTNYLLSCGAEFDPRARRRLQRDDLDDFTAKHLRDSLTLDHAPIELIPTPSGRVHGWVAVDGARIYMTDPNAGLLGEYDGPGEYNLLTGRPNITDPQDIIAIYEKDGVAKAFYTHDDMMIPIRNVTSDERYYGYGMPEPEEVLRVATAFMNAFTLNERGISDNALPRGILGLIGEADQDDLDQLSYRLQAEGKGAENRFRTHMMKIAEGGSVSWIPTGQEVEEQMYARWMTLQVAMACTAYSMNPEEIAFDSFSPGNTSLSGSDTEAKLTSGNDKGLTTLLKWYKKTLNELIALQDPDVELAWNGLGVSKEEALAREDSLMTWGEKRKRYGHTTDHIPEELLNMPLNPALGGVYQMTIQAQQQPVGPDGQPVPGQDGQGGGEEAEQQAQGGDAADPMQPQGPEDQRRFSDHEGGVWQAEHPDGPMSKAYTPDLSMWPGGDNG